MLKSMQGGASSHKSKASDESYKEEGGGGGHKAGSGSHPDVHGGVSGSGSGGGGSGPSDIATIRNAKEGIDVVESFVEQSESEKSEPLVAAVNINDKETNDNDKPKSVEEGDDMMMESTKYERESFTHTKKGDTIAEYKSGN